MGAPKLAPPAYRDDPDAVSMHTTPGDDYTDDAAVSTPSSAGVPPSYDDATIQGPISGVHGVGANHPTPERLPSGMPTGIHTADRWAAQGKSVKVIGRAKKLVCEVNKLQESRTDRDPEYLEAVIREMASHAPTPYIQIIGTHKERRRDRDGKGSRHETVTDFEILINMRNYLWPGFNVHSSNDMDLRTVENGDKTHRGTISKARAPGYKADIEIGDPKPDLREWCHRYCASSYNNRIFRVTRQVTGWDTLLLQSRIEGLIRSTNYRGHLSITFPVGDKHVDIHTSTRLQTWRLTTWIRWVFYLTFLWIFSWPALFFTTRKYAVVRAEWPFSLPTSNGGKTYTTVSEEQWVGRFGLAVRQLALDRYRGEAGDDLLTQTLSKPNVGQPRVDIGRAVNAARGVWSGGINAATGVNTLMRMGMGETGDQVGWGFDT